MRNIYMHAIYLCLREGYYVHYSQTQPIFSLRISHV